MVFCILLFGGASGRVFGVTAARFGWSCLRFFRAMFGSGVVLVVGTSLFP